MYPAMKPDLLRLFFCAFAAIVFCEVLGNSLLAVDAETASRIVFEEDSHDFGDIFRGERVSHKFTFSNQGTGDLVIENVKTSCGCTAAAPSNKTISPGTEAGIEVTFRSDVFRGNTRKTITVNSNDPDRPHYVLTIEANVLEEVVARPRQVFFEPVKQGQSVTKTVEVVPLTDLKLKIIKVRVASPAVKLRYEKKGEENAYLLEISTKERAPLGRFAGDVQVFTNAKRQNVLTIPFFGEIISDVSVFPDKISYGVVKKGQETLRQVLITIHKKDVRLEKFDVEPDYFSLNLIPDTKNYFHRLEIILGKDVPTGRLEGNLKIHTTSKNQPLLTIPIYGVVREG